MNQKLPEKVMVIDNHEQVAARISKAVSTMSMEMMLAFDLETVNYRLKREHFEVIFIDIGFKDIDALTFVQRYRKEQDDKKKNTVFVATLTNKLTADQSRLINEVGQILLLQKPFEIGPFVNSCSQALGLYQFTVNTQRAREAMVEKVKSGLLTQDEAMEELEKNRSTLKEHYVPFVLDVVNSIRDPGKALEKLNSLPPNDQQDLRVMSAIAAMQLKMGNLQEAKNFFEKADGLAPRNVERSEKMASMYLDLKDPQNAMKKQKELIEMHPDKPDQKFEYISDLEDHGFGQEAVEFCQQVSDPKDVVRYFNNKGVILSKSDQTDKAVSEYQKAINYFPKSTEIFKIHYNIAIAYAKKGNLPALKMARQHLTQSLELNPTNSKAKALQTTVRNNIKKLQ